MINLYKSNYNSESIGIISKNNFIRLFLSYGINQIIPNLNHVIPINFGFESSKINNSGIFI